MTKTLTLTFDGSAIKKMQPAILAAIDNNPAFAKGLDALLDSEPSPFEIRWEGLEARAFVSPRLADLMAAHGVSP